MKIIREANGKVIGMLSDDGNRVLAMTPSGRPLGWFNKKIGNTVRANGSVVGPGDQTMGLIYQEKGRQP
jgi:hypothetical protein